MRAEPQIPAAARRKMNAIGKALSALHFSKREVEGVEEEDGAIFREPIDDLPYGITIWITAVPSNQLINIALVSRFFVPKENIPSAVMALHQRQQTDCTGSLVIDLKSGQLSWRFDLPWQIDIFVPKAIAGMVAVMVKLGTELLITFIGEICPDEDLSLPAGFTLHRVR